MRALARRAALVLPALAFLAACGRRAEKPAVERLAVLRFENLGSEPSADWMGRAFSEVIAEELISVPGVYSIPSARLHAAQAALGPRPVTAPGISSERTMALLAGANRIAYGDYAVRGGRLEARLSVEDPRTGRTLRVLRASAPPADAVAAASELARGLFAQARSFPTRNREALEAWISALESTDADTRPLLERAIAADADFGPPYRMLAQWKAQRQDRAGALAVLAQATARGGAIGELERARMAIDAANLRGDAAGRLAALSALLRLQPNDPAAWRTLGDAALARRDFRQSVQALEKSLELEPDEAGSLNSLGYAAVYAGDFDLAVRSLRRYEALRPAEANPLDSLGDVHLVSGRYREAADFYVAAWKKSPPYAGGLFKAAMARLMAGDRAGGDSLAGQYADARAAAHDPMADSVRAEWSWLSGRREDGFRQLEAVASANEKGPAKDVAARAWAELATWELVRGDRAAAAAMAQRSAACAGPATAGLAALTRFLAQPSASAAEWQTRAAQLFPGALQTPAGGQTLAFALLLDGRFGEAAEVLKPVYENTGPVGEDASPILLAWALTETGRAQDAVPLLRFVPTPPVSGPSVAMAIYFPRVFQLRARAAQAAGRAEEARAAEALYRQLTGGQ